MTQELLIRKMHRSLFHCQEHLRKSGGGQLVKMQPFWCCILNSRINIAGSVHSTLEKSIVTSQKTRIFASLQQSSCNGTYKNNSLHISAHLWDMQKGFGCVLTSCLIRTL